MYQHGTIKKALEKIASNEYVLPAIQREFVWNPDQICRLFDSVMQGYPFGDFLFWCIEPERSADYRYYGFVREYHQRDDPHCPDLGPFCDRRIIAVLDGQQRLTAFNIGLRGSMAVKRPYKWWSSPDAFPRKVLALDVLAEVKRDEEGNRYSFKFVEEGKTGRQDGHLWFKVSDIMKMMDASDILDWLSDHELEKQEQKNASRILGRLQKFIHVERTIAYYKETNQDIEHVLSIFIRRNSGGITLSYSDLLLSIATSQWRELDARKEVHQLVDDLNRIGSGSGLALTKDFVLKAGLMLTDIASVGFQVRNFTQSNMAVLEKNWQRIRESLISTVQLVTGFGFDANSIRATSALLPIAYHLYQIGTPRDFDTAKKYEDDRKAIRGWLTRTILKASGIWGSGLDALLTALREALREAGGHGYPVAELRHAMAQRGKSLEFNNEEIEDLADMELNDRRIFALLALLFPFVDCRHHKFHIDHVFPKSRFTRKRLQSAGIDDSQFDFNDLADRANRIGNLQLLEGATNNQKCETLPAEWLQKQYPDPAERQHYCDLYVLVDIPADMSGFLDFYTTRRDLLWQRIVELVNSV